MAFLSKKLTNGYFSGFYNAIFIIAFFAENGHEIFFQNSQPANNSLIINTHHFGALLRFCTEIPIWCGYKILWFK